MCKAMEDLRNESYAEGREEGLLKEMGYVYGNRESTFGEGRLSLFFAAMHSKEAADGRSCR